MRSPGPLDALRVPDLDGVATLDLSGITWVTPALIAGAAALAARTRSQGQPFTLLRPHHPDAAGYLARMRLGKTLTGLGVQHDLPHVYERDRRGHLLELTPIHSETDVNELATLVHDKVDADDPGLADALYRSLCEVGDNVADHASGVGYLVAQTMPTRNELRISVADGGVGLLHWLGPARGARDHSEALDIALSGVSRHDEPERGNGIIRTLNLVQQMSGSAMFASGDAWSRDRGTRRDTGRCPHSYAGTLFEATIPLGTGKHAARTLD